jgi:hypothetical protein
MDLDTGEDLAKAVRKYHLPDFSNRKHHNVFEATFPPPALKLRLGLARLEIELRAGIAW